VNHRGLENQAQGALRVLHESWAHTKRVTPFLLTWPGRPVPDHDGSLVKGTVKLDLSDTPKSVWSRDIREAVELTGAVAILLCEQLEDRVLVILESRYGTTSWQLPIQQRGDVDILGQPSTHINLHSIGILWRKFAGTA
jgi:hypothetical protein